MAVYRFRVTIDPDSPLFQAEEPVCRDVELDDSHTLTEFHEAIFDAFDRYDEHAYEFMTLDAEDEPEQQYVDPITFDNTPGVEETATDEVKQMLGEDAPDEAVESVTEALDEVHGNRLAEASAAETTIADLELSDDDVLRYLFDFGDSWDHHVELRETREGSADGGPAVVERHGKSPPQYPEPDGRP